MKPTGAADMSAAESTNTQAPAPPTPVSDGAVRVVVWISALILLSPVFIFVYVYWIKRRLLGG